MKLNISGLDVALIDLDSIGNLNLQNSIISISVTKPYVIKASK